MFLKQYVSVIEFVESRWLSGQRSDDVKNDVRTV